jgi:hypothetical protein
LGNGPACGKMLIMRLADLDPERVSAELTGWATAFARGQARREVQLATITAGAREQA